MRYILLMEDIPEAVLVETDRNAGGHPWRIRRRLMFSVVGFSMAAIAWCLYQDSDSQVHQAAVSMGFTTLISITGTYVFGAVWSDQ